MGRAHSAVAVCEGSSGEQPLTCNGLKQALTGPESGVGRTPEPSARALVEGGEDLSDVTSGQLAILHRSPAQAGFPSGYQGSGELSLVFKLWHVSATHEVLVALLRL